MAYGRTNALASPHTATVHLPGKSIAFEELGSSPLNTYCITPPPELMSWKFFSENVTKRLFWVFPEHLTVEFRNVKVVLDFTGATAAEYKYKALLRIQYCDASQANITYSSLHYEIPSDGTVLNETVEFHPPTGTNKDWYFWWVQLTYSGNQDLYGKYMKIKLYGDIVFSW